jgi:hypothetical protein
VLHHEQPQDHLNRRRRTSGLRRARPTSAQIGFDLLKDLIVVEQLIQFGQLGLEAQLERRHQRKQVDRHGSVS